MFTTPPGAAAARPRRSRFFVALAIILLLIVLAGFSRTFYLRAFFDVPPIPGHVYAHGAILTAWFVWFCVQTSLVAGGRTALHRRLGITGALLGVAVILANITVLAAVAPRLRVVLQGSEFNPAFIVSAIWGDVGSTIAFAVFLGSALAFRHRPDIHGRLMLLASVSIVGQALGRIALWPVFAAIPKIALPAGGLLFFLGALLIHDLVTLKRVHPATIVGGAFRVLIWLATAAIAASEFGQAVVRGMT